jgi:plastocyanin
MKTVRLILGAAVLLAVVAAGGQLTAQEQQVTIEISAKNIAFNKDTLTVPAGAKVLLEFTNQEAAPHNVAVYETDRARNEIFKGEVFSGPDRTVTYEFTAPEEPGTYFFRCDVHPRTMVGDFIVE